MDVAFPFHQATAEANNLAAVAAAKDQYYKAMEKVSLLKWTVVGYVCYTVRAVDWVVLASEVHIKVQRFSLKAFPLRCVVVTCPMWLPSLLRRNTSFTSKRLFTAFRPPRRWVAKSFVTDTKHSLRRSWRKCASHSASTMRSEDDQRNQNLCLDLELSCLLQLTFIWRNKVSIFLTLILFPFKVQKSLQCLPDPCRAVCLGVPSIRAVQCVNLHRPGHLRLDMWLCYGPDHGGCADVGLHPLLWTLS